MTLKLNLTPEQAARLETQARRKGLAVKEYALRRLLGTPEETAPEGVRGNVPRRVSGFGQFAHVKTSSEEYAGRKSAEIDREDRPR